MRLIGKDALIADIERTIEESGCVNHEGEIMDCIRYASEVDAVPVVRGEWLFIANGIEAPECSVCGWAVFSRDFKNRSDLPPYHKYCGHCGAKMEGSDT